MKSSIFSSLTASLLLLCALPAAAAPPPLDLRGTVASATPKAVVISTPSGMQTVDFGSKMHFFGIAASSLAHVTKDSFIGTTVVPQADGTYRSTEVHIFAPSLRGTGEGFTKMNRQGTRMMANAAVKSVARPSNMMANSTVRSVASRSGNKEITMVFDGVTKRITIPAHTPVVAIDPGTKAMLVRGAHVEVVAESLNGHLVAHTIIVGEHGIVPPM